MDSFVNDRLDCWLMVVVRFFSFLKVSWRLLGERFRGKIVIKL